MQLFHILLRTQQSPWKSQTDLSTEGRTLVLSQYNDTQNLILKHYQS